LYLFLVFDAVRRP